MPIEGITELITTYGISGVCVILFGIVIWLIRLLLGTQKEVSEAYVANTAAFVKFCDVVQSLEETIKTNSAETRKLSEQMVQHIARDH